ncbi:hypothetical protein F4859DRAFT_437388 [Xylaria cf. heliscus]|nr:hypothetical protein F4859DRAFT_437388 [Xylaria cf. heliscus]
MPAHGYGLGLIRDRGGVKQRGYDKVRQYNGCVTGWGETPADGGKRLKQMGGQAIITARSSIYPRFQLRRQHQGVPDRAYHRWVHYSIRRYDRTGPYLTGQPPEFYDDLFLDEFGRHQCGFSWTSRRREKNLTHKMEFFFFLGENQKSLLSISLLLPRQAVARARAKMFCLLFLSDRVVLFTRLNARVLHSCLYYL